VVQRALSQSGERADRVDAQRQARGVTAR
jgi:hypothetical protein